MGHCRTQGCCDVHFGDNRDVQGKEPCSSWKINLHAQTLNLHLVEVENLNLLSVSHDRVEQRRRIVKLYTILDRVHQSLVCTKELTKSPTDTLFFRALSAIVPSRPIKS